MLSVNKIIYDLINKNILIKIKGNEHKNGRPKLKVTLNPNLYSALITKEDGYFIVTYINLHGASKYIFKLPTDIFENERNTLNLVKGNIGTIDYNCLKMFYVDENANTFKEIKPINNYTPINILIDAFSDDEKVIYIKCADLKILINHNKAKIISLDEETLNQIIDIDQIYNFDNIKEAIIESIPKLTLKSIEKII